MKALIVYFSRSGNTEKIGKELASKIDADTEQIKDKTKRKGILGWLSSGRDSMKKRTTDIEKLNHKPQEYDVVIIGTPVWAGNVPPATRTILEKYHRKIDNVAFFSTSKSGETTKMYNTMAKIIGIDTISTLSITEKEIKKDSYQEKMDEFINKITKYME